MTEESMYDQIDRSYIDYVVLRIELYHFTDFHNTIQRKIRTLFCDLSSFCKIFRQHYKETAHYLFTFRKRTMVYNFLRAANRFAARLQCFAGHVTFLFC